MYELTDLQQSYYLAKKGYNNQVKHGCQTYCEFERELIDVDRLKSAWLKLCDRHHMLNVYISIDGKQVPHDIPTELQLDEYYITDPANTEIHIDSVRSRMMAKVYEPGVWPLYDIAITHLPNGVDRLHVCIDSSIVDARSAQVLFQDWLAYYDGLELKPTLESFNFFSYMHEKSKLADNTKKQKHLQYWLNKTAGRLSGPDFLKTAAEFNQLNIQQELDKQTLIKLENSAKELGVSINVFLLTLFADSMAAWSASPDFSILVTQQNRLPLLDNIEDCIGPFSTANFFVPRVDSADFDIRLMSNYEQMWSDMDHMSVGASDVIRASQNNNQQVKYSNVVFSSMINNKKNDNRTWFDNLVYTKSQTPNIDLECQIWVADEKLHICWNYNEYAITSESITSIFAAFIKAITSLNSTTIPQIDIMPTSQVHLTQLQKLYLNSGIQNNQLTHVYQEFSHSKIDPVKLTEALRAVVSAQPMLRSYITQLGKLAIAETFDLPFIAVTDFGQVEPKQKAKVLEDYRQQLLRKPLVKGERQLYDIHVSRWFDADIVHIRINMLIADGLSVLLLYNQLFSAYAKKTTLEKHETNGYKIPNEYQALISQYWHTRIQQLNKSPQLSYARITPSVELNSQRWCYQFKEWSQLKSMAKQANVSAVHLVKILFAGVIQYWSSSKKISLPSINLARELRAVPSAMLGDFSSLAWLSFSEDSESLIGLAQETQHQLEKDNAFNPCGILPEMMTSQHYPIVITDAVASDLAVEHQEFKSGYGISKTPGVSFDCYLAENLESLECHWDVDTTVYDTGFIDLIHEHFKQALASFCVEFGQSNIDTLQNYISRIANGLVIREMHNKLIKRWNETSVDYDRQQTLAELFQLSANKYADNIALIIDDMKITYKQLDNLASQIAHLFAEKGIAKGDFVGVCLDRSQFMVASVLAIHKLGAAFVPIDITMPGQRVLEIVKSAEIKHIISDTQQEIATFSLPANLIFLDDNYHAIQKKPAKFDVVKAVSNSPAYIIFTSGSTGTPKGVLVNHKPVINLIEWVNTSFDMNEDDRVLFINPLSFDLSIYDIFGLLACGGSIKMVNDSKRYDAAYLAKQLLSGDITFWNSAPASLQMLSTSLPSMHEKIENHGSKLRLVFLSGDWIPLSLPKTIKNYFSNARVISLGGATEATVWSNYHCIDRIEPSWQSIPYGRPIQNSKYYILDDDRQHVSIGSVGKLYIGGDCLSEGYVNNPEQNAKHYHADPFSKGASLYYTGDLARYYGDGVLEIIGRADQQIKLRGYRIEIDEVESALQSLGFDQSIVVLRDKTTNSPYLAAFYLGRPDLDDHMIRARLAKLLPEYMLPARYIALNHFPVTSNGKADRSTLANLTLVELQEKYQSKARVEPKAKPLNKAANDTRSKVRSLIADVISIDESEISDQNNIGEYGFNSMYYTLLSSKLHEQFSVDMPPNLFFKHNTVVDITDYVASVAE